MMWFLIVIPELIHGTMRQLFIAPAFASKARGFGQHPIHTHVKGLLS